MKDTTETAGQRNSTETAPQNCVKLCSYEGHNVQICIFTGNADLILLRSNLYPLFSRLPVTNAWNCHSYSFLKQCWSVGYVSLLTLSFIADEINFWLNVKWLDLLIGMSHFVYALSWWWCQTCFQSQYSSQERLHQYQPAPEEYSGNEGDEEGRKSPLSPLLRPRSRSLRYVHLVGQNLLYTP